MNRIYKFILYISSPRSCRFDFEEEINLLDGYKREDLEQMSEEAIEDLVEEYAQEILFDRYINYGFDEVKNEQSI